MSDVFFLVLRRLRTPLIVLILAYAFATLGMTLVPGVDPQGNAWHMSFFHAFYFVSFMGTTIGFGELPYEFSDAQRAWVLVCIYSTVFSWLYAIGNMLRLLQDSAFQQAISERVFRRNINRIDQPFYIICGFGETGSLINEGLSLMGFQTVIIARTAKRTSLLELQNLTFAPIVLIADATEPKNLLAAGLNSPQCQGVIAVTEDDHTNLQIAVSCKLLDREVPVICRSEIEDEAENMASFGTDTIINPYVTFANRLNLLAHHPSLHRIQNWLINQYSPEHLTDRELPKGRWIICGYGRLGKAIHSHLLKDGIDFVIVDPDPVASNAPPGAIVGRGTEARTLIEAGILEASVVVAASSDDANNLSALITARQINKDIYTIGRVSKEANQSLFVKAECDYVMRRSQLIANETLTIISRPLVSNFIKYSGSLSAEDTDRLIAEICALTDDTDPITLRVVIDRQDSPAIADHLETGKALTIAQLCQNDIMPGTRCIALLLQRDGVSHLLPGGVTPLEMGDALLVCSKRDGRMLPQLLRENPELIDSLINHNPHHIPFLRWWSRSNSPQNRINSQNE